MATKVISYSYTGNNDALAEKYANAIGAEHFRIEEKRRRTMLRIVADTIVESSPKLKRSHEEINRDDKVFVFAPIWMGKIATPARPWLKKIGECGADYGFISISGGADGPDSNDRVLTELETRVGRPPAVFEDLHIADLLPDTPQPTREITMGYRLTEDDLDVLLDRLPVSLN